MENKGLLAGLVAIAVVALSALAFISLKSPSVIVTGGGNTPSIVSLGGNSSEEPRYGGTTNLDSLGLSGDLTVGGSQTVTGNQAVTGNLTVTGTSTFSGGIAGNVPTRLTVTMTNSTTTPCAIQNTSGSDRTLVAVGVSETAYVGAGVVGLSVGTSTSAFSSGGSPLIAHSLFSNSATKNVISTTSTLMDAYANWGSNEWLTFATVTTTNAGSCRVLFY